MRTKILIIHNKMAGRLKAPMLSRVLEQLERQGVEVRLQAAASVREDIDLARSAALANKVDAVVAAGGDSTIRGVAMGLMGTKMPLGIIPAGTGNVLAYEIGLGRDPQKIAATLISGNLKTVKPGLANGEPFLLMAGVGLDAQIVKHLNHDLKQRIRKAAYIWPTLKALAAKPSLFDVECRDEKSDQQGRKTYRASFVIITKICHYGGSFVIAPHADLGDDNFQVVMFTRHNRFGLVSSLMAIAKGLHMVAKPQSMNEERPIERKLYSHGLIIRSCQNVAITPQAPVPTQIDGEWLGTTPLDIAMSDQTIQMIVPLGKA